MSYENRLLKVTDYISEHLDDDISLETLSDIACFSKYHFHRLFTAFTGMSLSQYIKWLRLTRAANQLATDDEQSILKIASHAGFESHEAFTRAFKKAFEQTPNEFRKNLTWKSLEMPPYRLPQRGDNKMKVEIKEIPQKRLAAIEHCGDPRKIIESRKKLIDWSRTQTINLKPAPGEAFGIGYNDPDTTEPSEFRIDLGFSIPENFKLTGEIVEKFLPAGRYACAMHKGTRRNIAETVYALYRDWLPQSGEELGDMPIIFAYYTFDDEVAETASLTECRLLLK